MPDFFLNLFACPQLPKIFLVSLSVKVNTVVIMLKNEQNVRNARIFLLIDAIAPVFGILVASFFVINQSVLAVMLAAFAGQFLYIGAANLLPETYHHNAWKMGLSMIFGVLLIFVLTFII